MFVALMGKVYWASSDGLTVVRRVCTGHLQMSPGASGNTAPALEGADAKSPMQIAGLGPNQRCLVCRLVAVSLRLSCSCVCSLVADVFCSSRTFVVQLFCVLFARQLKVNNMQVF